MLAVLVQVAVMFVVIVPVIVVIVAMMCVVMDAVIMVIVCMRCVCAAFRLEWRLD